MSRNFKQSKTRREYLDRDVEDHDFFSTYVSEPRWVVGDQAPLVEAAGDDRIEVAQELIRSADPDLREGWTAYCRSDPQGAFDVLAKGTPTADKASLWTEFILSIALGHEASVTIREEIASKVFDHLAGVEMEFLRTISSDLAILLKSIQRTRITDVDRWLTRLWEAALMLPQKRMSIKTYESAIDNGRWKGRERAVDRD